MEKRQNTPTLRFRGFTGEWEKKRLGTVVEIIMGQSPDGNTYFDVPCGHILVQGNADLENGWVKPRIWTTQVTKTAKAGDLIMSVRAPAGAMGKTAYDVVLGRGVAAIKGNAFIYHSLVKLDSTGYWSKYSSGSTFESLNSNNIQAAELFLPSQAEQEALGNFFDGLDEQISSTEQKIEKFQQFRQAMLTKLFPAEGASEPALRFRGFSGPWEIHPLNYYLETSNEKNMDDHFDKKDVLSVSGDFGIVNQIKFQGRSFAGASVSSYGVVSVGDIVYTKSPLINSPYGIIKTNKQIPGIVSTLYAVYHPKETVVPDFVECYFDCDSRLNRYLKPLVNKGAKNDMKVSADNALLGNVIFPNREEQQKIADFFQRLDNFLSRRIYNPSATSYEM